MVDGVFECDRSVLPVPVCSFLAALVATEFRRGGCRGRGLCVTVYLREMLLVQPASLAAAHGGERKP